MERITIATDGSVLVNPNGPGGWAWVNDRGESASAGVPSTTNNIMELRAILEAIRAHPGHPLLIQSDSQYAINCVTVWCHTWAKNGWKRKGGPVANADLIRMIRVAMHGRDIQFEWVRGHNGHVLNEQADKLAGIAARAVEVRPHGA